MDFFKFLKVQSQIIELTQYALKNVRETKMINTQEFQVGRIFQKLSKNVIN